LIETSAANQPGESLDDMLSGSNQANNTGLLMAETEKDLKIKELIQTGYQQNQA